MKDEHLQALEAEVMPDDFTKEDVVKKINEHMIKRNWIRSSEYTVDEYSQRHGNDPGPVMKNRKLWVIFKYLTEAMEDVVKYRFDDSLVMNEIRKADFDGDLCLYVATLTAVLLYEFAGIDRDDIELVQGYYIFRADPSLPFSEYFGKYQMGLHAWCEVKGTLMDFSVITQAPFIRLPHKEGIIGTNPSGLKLIGVSEPFATAKEYARKLAATQGITYYDWINKHVRCMFERK